MTRIKKISIATFGLMFAPNVTFAANIPDAGEEPGVGLSVFETFFWFIGVPAAIMGAVTFVWAIGNWRKAAENKSVVVWHNEN